MAKKKEKKPKKPHPLHKLFDVKGDSLLRKNKHCPKCGPGYFLANHKSRQTCGACGYTEFQTKTTEAKA